MYLLALHVLGPCFTTPYLKHSLLELLGWQDQHSWQKIDWVYLIGFWLSGSTGCIIIKDPRLNPGKGYQLGGPKRCVLSLIENLIWRDEVNGNKGILCFMLWMALEAEWAIWYNNTHPSMALYKYKMDVKLWMNFVHTNFHRAGFELGSLGRQASMLQI